MDGESKTFENPHAAVRASHLAKRMTLEHARAWCLFGCLAGSGSLTGHDWLSRGRGLGGHSASLHHI